MEWIGAECIALGAVSIFRTPNFRVISMHAIVASGAT